VDLRLNSLPPGVFGETQLDTRPFVITLNPNVVKSRAEVSLAHELVHVLSELYKLDLTHEQIHDVAPFIVSEIVPTINAFNNAT